MQNKALETRHFQSITFPNSALLAQKNHCAQHVPSHLAEHFSGEAFVRNPPNKIQWTSFCCCCSSASKEPAAKASEDSLWLPHSVKAKACRIKSTHTPLTASKTSCPF